MSEQRKPVISAYSQLSTILNELKSEKISINEAMNKIQLKESAPTRPYCKVTSSGSLALYGVTKQPIVLYPEQWNKLSKVIKSGYLENYIKYNESRLKFKPKYILKRPQQQFNNSSNYTEEEVDYDDEVIPQEGVENI
jgi:hypothetical protein